MKRLQGKGEPGPVLANVIMQIDIQNQKLLIGNAKQRFNNSRSLICVGVSAIRRLITG